MPVGVGTMLAVGAISAGATAGAGIYAANKQSSAQRQAGTLQASAEAAQRKYLEAKDRQDQANFERTQRLNREQADRTERNQRYEFDTTNALNRQQYDQTEALNLDQYNREQLMQSPFYEQSAAKNRSMAYWLNLDQQHGATYIDRVPPPALSHAQAFGGGGASAPLPSIDMTGVAPGDWTAARVADYFKSRGVTPAEGSPDYWAGKWNEFGKKDPAYYLSRLATAEEFGGAPAPAGGGFGSGTPAAAAPPRTLSNVYGQPAAVGGVWDPKTKQYVVPTPRPKVDTLADLDAYMASTR